MAQQDFSDSTLVLVAHGSGCDPDAAAPVYQHAAELRHRPIFGAVHEAFWKQAPVLADVLAHLESSRLFIVPFFLSEGYFSERIIPQALGFQTGEGTTWERIQVQKNRTLFYCKVVGTHPDITQVALHRAAEVVRSFPFPRAPEPAASSLIIAGHGTERDENSRAAVQNLVEGLRSLKSYADVHAVYLEEQPPIGSAYELATTDNVVVVPFFAGEGPHVKKDIPVALGAHENTVEERLRSGLPPWRNPTERYGKLVWYAQPVGTDPRVADIVLKRVREAAS